MSETTVTPTTPHIPQQGYAKDVAGAFRGTSWDSVGATFIINLLSLVLPLTLMQVYDRIIPNAAFSTLTLLVLGAGVAMMLEAFLQYLRALTSGWSAARFEHLEGCRAMERMLSARLSKFEEQGIGEHLENFNSLGRLKDFYSGQAMRALIDLPFALIFVAAVAYLGGWLALVTASVLILFTLTAAWLGRQLRVVLLERVTTDNRRQNFIVEVLSGIGTVKAMAMEAQMARRFERLQENCSNTNYKVAQASAYANGASTYFSYAMLFAVAATGSLLVIDGTLSVGGLAACTLLSGRAMQPLQRAMGAWTRFQDVRIARERLEKVFNLDVDTTSLAEQPKLTGQEALELDGVSFSYPGDGRPLLRDVNLRVEPGKTIAIRAEATGSGKTTLLHLMAGVLEPTAGTVRLGSYDIADLSPATKGKTMTYLPSKGTAMKGTILENLTMFRPHRMAVALELSRRLGLDNIAAQLPRGYETIIGDGVSDTLSQGVMQRISLVRGLATQAQFILFDEANSAIDGAGDVQMRTLLQEIRKKAGLILISHRPSLLKLADEMYELKDGQIIRAHPTPTPPAPPGTTEAAR
ncbi:MAG: ATP-binding cassette domain-containing protein [Alphaproteobacteria bacterium]|nr:ATP-binding cassette domain-containing protein [Alphaproteobacteria bacterium]